jgi:O-acetyl-ADP-ribose deacetylase (regulator of RNase III)
VPRIVLVRGDITVQDVDAVVNAANTALRPGGGVDGAITSAAGPDALADRERVIRERGDPPLPTGQAVATIGGALAARWIIHTAGPIYSGSPDDPRLLASCHTESLRVADELGARTIAFPAISTGVYGYPNDEAAPVAIEAVASANTDVDEVRFVLFDDRSMQAFEAALNGTRRR